jgi:glycerol-1-phosphate dehydrogenase [NAD(P)+]
VLQPNRLERADLLRHFGEVIGDACWRELELKRFDAAQTDELNHRLAREWDAMRARLRAVGVGAATLHGLLSDAGAPVAPAAIGWSAALFEQAWRHAREIRNRYTFLDLAADS